MRFEPENHMEGLRRRDTSHILTPLIPFDHDALPWDVTVTAPT